MNLNFTNDNDKVHVQTQNQVACKQEIILKIKLLSEDMSDFSSINCSLCDTHHIFSSIVKDLYEYVTACKQKQFNKQTDKHSKQEKQTYHKKKKISIPYGTVRKLDNLKQKFVQCRKIIETQNQRYYFLNANKQNLKQSQVRFYKQVLHSYQTQRQYYKKRTLSVQDRIQIIQAQITRQNCKNHGFTDFNSKILSFGHIFNSEKKTTALEKVLRELKLYQSTRLKIRRFFQSMNKTHSPVIEKGFGLKEDQALNIQNKIPPKVQHNVATNESHPTSQQTALFLLLRNTIKQTTEMQLKINLLSREKVQILELQMRKLQKRISKLKAGNEIIKKGIIMWKDEKYYLEIEKQVSRLESTYKPNKKEKRKITKTDFMIYFKQLNSRINSYFKNKDIFFSCRDSSSFKLTQRSKSCPTFRV